MIVSAHQPGYLPWLGYFDKIRRSDVFVVMDTVQLTSSSTRNFINRNKVKTAHGPIWLTVPVKRDGYRDRQLRELEIDYEQDWIGKHLRTIEVNYRRAKNFDPLFGELCRTYETRPRLFTELCSIQLRFWLDTLSIRTRIEDLSTLGLTSKKSDLILDICKSVGASTYFSGAVGREYLDEEQFRQAQIALEFQDYVHPEYPQLHGDFVPNMGVIDYLMNVQLAAHA